MARDLGASRTERETASRALENGQASIRQMDITLGESYETALLLALCKRHQVGIRIDASGETALLEGSATDIELVLERMATLRPCLEEVVATAAAGWISAVAGVEPDDSSKGQIPADTDLLHAAWACGKQKIPEPTIPDGPRLLDVSDRRSGTR